MTKVELDSYLREHSFAETSFLACNCGSDVSTDKISPASGWLIEACMRKHFPMLTSKDVAASWIDKKLQTSTKMLEYSRRRIIFSCQPRFVQIPAHNHSYIEMIYVYSGSSRQTVNGRHVLLNRGDVCLLGPNVVHSVEAAEEDDISINCILSKDYLQSILLSRLSGNDLITSFLVQSIYRGGDFSEYMVFHSGESPKIEQLLDDILREFFDRTPCTDEEVSSYMTLVFYELTRIHSARRLKRVESANSESMIPAVIGYVRENCRTARLSSTAAHFHLNANYLGMKLKEVTGKNFTEILHDEKLKTACLLLSNSEIPIVEIVNEVGYENVSFFYRMFKDKYNCTPAEFRKDSGIAKASRE